MLLPALGKARAKARSISCVNNLKHCGLAFLMYADDYNGSIIAYCEGTNIWNYPKNGDNKRYNQIWPGFMWFFGYIPDGDLNSIACPAKNHGKMYEVSSGRIQPFACFGTPFSWYSEALCRTTDPAPWNNTKTYMTGAMTSPTCSPYLADSMAVNGVSQVAGSPAEKNMQWPNIAGSAYMHARHGERVNMGFFDGHAASLKPQEVRSTISGAGVGKEHTSLTYHPENGSATATAY